MECLTHRVAIPAKLAISEFGFQRQVVVIMWNPDSMHTRAHAFCAISSRAWVDLAGQSWGCKSAPISNVVHLSNSNDKER